MFLKEGTMTDQKTLLLLGFKKAYEKKKQVTFQAPKPRKPKTDQLTFADKIQIKPTTLECEKLNKTKVRINNVISTFGQELRFGHKQKR